MNKRLLVVMAAVSVAMGIGLSGVMAAGAGGITVTSESRAAERGAARAAVTADTAPVAGRGRGRGEAASAQREANIDKREANQEKRIDEGIKKGQLTPDEVASLQEQEKNIVALQAQFMSDGKLTKDEAKQLREELNNASLQIWAQRHDTEGNQKPVSRLGKDIIARDELTNKIESGDMTRPEARAFLEDFHQLVILKRRLGSENLTEEQRAKLQAQYNDLLNKYFLIK